MTNSVIDNSNSAHEKPLPLFDETEVRKAWDLIVLGAGSVHEVRILSHRPNPNTSFTQTTRGYFNSVDALITALKRLKGSAPGVFVTLNPVKADLLARAANRFEEKSRHTASDADIVGRNWILIDCDPVRPSGVSAKNSEKFRAGAVAGKVGAWLKAQGWQHPVICDSGNGYHLLIRVKLPNTEESRQLVERFLNFLADRFNNDEVKIDRAVGNAARIVKLYGTKSGKGDHLPERPHRMSKPGKRPEKLTAVTREQIEALLPPKPDPKPKLRLAVNREFVLSEFMQRYSIEGKPKSMREYAEAYLIQCPFNADHGGNGETHVGQRLDGKLAFSCKHDSCADKSWRDFRQHFEPDAYQQKEYSPQNDGPPPNFDPNVPQQASPKKARPAPEKLSFEQFSLSGKAQEMERRLEDEVYLLDRLALVGQITVFYGAPNAGKTLITLSLLINAIKEERIKPENVFFINADDSYKGIVEKLKLAEKHGFHQLAPGHNGFKAQDLQTILQQVTAADTAKDKIVILDSLKKFTDTMSKTDSRRLGITLREFNSKGGTCVGLGHTNKNRNEEGKRVYSGVADIVEDVDAVYVLDVDEKEIAGGVEKVVTFESQKSRGDNDLKVAYSYQFIQGKGYPATLDSVKRVDEREARRVRYLRLLQDSLTENEEIVAALEGAIKVGAREGGPHGNTKREIIDAVNTTTGVAKNKIRKTLELHDGDSWKMGHRWKHTVGENNSRLYELLIFHQGGADA